MRDSGCTPCSARSCPYAPGPLIPTTQLTMETNREARQSANPTRTADTYAGGTECPSLRTQAASRFRPRRLGAELPRHMICKRPPVPRSRRLAVVAATRARPGAESAYRALGSTCVRKKRFELSTTNTNGMPMRTRAMRSTDVGCSRRTPLLAPKPTALIGYRRNSR